MATKEKEKEVVYHVGTGGGTVEAAVDVGLGQEGFVSIAIETEKTVSRLEARAAPASEIGQADDIARQVAHRGGTRLRRQPDDEQDERHCQPHGR